jgi:hypothetical protein
VKDAIKMARVPGLLALPLALLSGCTHMIKPDTLSAPTTVTCLDVTQPISFQSEPKGLVKVTWRITLAKGPYVAEKESGAGIFYRAMPGAIYNETTDHKGRRWYNDGGVFIPRDKNGAPQIYRYFSAVPTPAHAPPENLDCSNVGFERDVSGKKINVLSFAAPIAVGAATGGMIGRSIHPSGVRMSYGQAAGVGLVGGLIGGLIVAAMINKDVGKIVMEDHITDPAAAATLMQLAANGSAARESGHAAPAMSSPTVEPPQAPAQEDTSAAVSATPPIPSPSPVSESTTVAMAQKRPVDSAETPVIDSASAQPMAAAPPVAPVDAGLMSKAQDLATKMRCGAVQPNGGTTFRAACDSYSVLIDCEGGQCRPLHTIH